MKKLLLIVSFIVFSIVRSEAQEGKTIPASNLNTQGSILRFYPNPATTAITFDFQKSFDKGYSLQIYNFLGRKLIEQSNISDHTTINLTDFTRGMFVYQLRDKTGRLVESGKFQVSK